MTGGRASRETELGTEIQCAACCEFWPADPEFFYFAKGKPHSWCKACYAAAESTKRKRERWLEKQAARRASARTQREEKPE